LVQLNKNKSLLKAFAIAGIVLVVFALGLWMGWHKDQLGARLRHMHTVLTPTIASPSLAPMASIVAASSLSHSAIDPAPAEPTSPSPAPAATLLEAKPTPKDTAADNSTLDSLLKQEGFGVVKLKQKNLDNQKPYKNDPKHLIIDVEVNRVSASLIVDTGTPTTNIARGSLKKFGLVEQKTPYRVSSPLG
jgi:hypothetical protein